MNRILIVLSFIVLSKLRFDYLAATCIFIDLTAKSGDVELSDEILLLPAAIAGGSFLAPLSIIPAS